MESERDIEAKVTRYAAKLGWVGFKFTSPSSRGVPDRIYLRDGQTVFVEFKRTGERPRAQQRAVFREFDKAGHRVHIIDNIDDGRGLFDALGPSRVPTAGDSSSPQL